MRVRNRHHVHNAQRGLSVFPGLLQLIIVRLAIIHIQTIPDARIHVLIQIDMSMNQQKFVHNAQVENVRRHTRTERVRVNSVL